MLKKHWLICLMISLAGMCLALGALAEEAPDLTALCAFKGSNNTKMLKYLGDNDYSTYWRSQGGAAAKLRITLPEGEEAWGLYLKWYDKPTRCQVMTEQDGEWRPIAQTDGTYLAEYIPLPQGVRDFRLCPAPKVKSRMVLAEVRVLGRGEAPAWVQRWEPPAEKADLLVISAHPDDEILFMGGTIPYYAGERGKTVQVAYLTRSMPYRRLELLDGLWLCGVRNYPDIGPMGDNFASSLVKMYKVWSKDKLYGYIVKLYRRYKPQVVVTHDINGEYGHAAHKAAADAAMKTLRMAAGSKYFKSSYTAYGAWDVPKLYLHLYDENVVDMDWRQPLGAFQGKTAFDMAQAAFQCHASQLKTRYVVEDFGPYDNSLFGLYRSLVGPDTHGGDFFENIPEN